MTRHQRLIDRLRRLDARLRPVAMVVFMVLAFILGSLLLLSL